MKNIVYLSVIIFLVLGCKSKKHTSRVTAHVTPIPVIVRETVHDTVTIIKPVMVQRVKLTSGNNMLRYCIIVGSFFEKPNAVNLQSKLNRQGMVTSSILQNEEGMYQVSAFCTNSLKQAQKELEFVRERYPEYTDAWILEIPDK